jgi:hypothetical protein
MSLISCRSARRSITTATVGLLAAASLTSCGLSTTSVADPTTTSQPASSGSEQRLGCGTYCQSAGGIAGTMGPGKDPVRVVSRGTVAIDADGYVPVTLTCNLSVQCRGSLILQLMFGPPDPSTGLNVLARSDLLLDAGATATLAVKLPTKVLPYLPSHQPPCQTGATGELNCPNVAGVIADVGPSFGCAGWSMKPTGLPNCGGVVNGFNPAGAGVVYLVAAG